MVQDVLLAHAAATLEANRPFFIMVDGSHVKLEDDVVRLMLKVLQARCVGDSGRAMAYREISKYLGDAATRKASIPITLNGASVSGFFAEELEYFVSLCLDHISDRVSFTLRTALSRIQRIVRSNLERP